MPSRWQQSLGVLAEGLGLCYLWVPCFLFRAGVYGCVNEALQLVVYGCVDEAQPAWTEMTSTCAVPCQAARVLFLQSSVLCQGGGH